MRRLLVGIAIVVADGATAAVGFPTHGPSAGSSSASNAASDASSDAAAIPRHVRGFAWSTPTPDGAPDILAVGGGVVAAWALNSDWVDLLDARTGAVLGRHTFTDIVGTVVLAGGDAWALVGVGPDGAPQLHLLDARTGALRDDLLPARADEAVQVVPDDRGGVLAAEAASHDLVDLTGDGQVRWVGGAVDGNVVYADAADGAYLASTAGGDLRIGSLATGTSTLLSLPGTSDVPNESYAVLLAVRDGRAVVSARGDLDVVDVAARRIISDVEVDAAVSATSFGIAATDRVALFVSAQGLQGVDLRTGKQVWQRSEPRVSFDVEDGTFVLGGTQISALDLDTGRTRWSDDRCVNPMTADAATAVAICRSATSSARVFAGFDAATGRVLWHVTGSSEGDPDSGSIEYDFGKAYDGGLVVVDGSAVRDLR
jgi:hypothetical protein